MNAARPSTLSVWLQAARPKTLLIGVAPVTIGLGVAWADGSWDLRVAAMTLACGLLVQVLANLINDYYDWKKGADGPERLGPPRVTQMGWVSPGAMRAAILALSLLIAAGGWWLSRRGGAPILLLTGASLLFAYLYTGGPYPLGYHGIADGFAFLFFGPVAAGATYYLQTDLFPPHLVVAGSAPGFYSAALLSVNNLRDREGDARSGKRTPAVRFGERFMRFEYTACLVGALACAVAFALMTRRPACLGALAALAVALPALRLVYTPAAGARLNAALGMTSLSSTLFAILLTAGYLFT
ncbi:MAG: 1,4-dihydroxy-2-naphthoate octaprenyltransferase [Spirochaetes bacterium]|nr:1,4-dihydroxy-2-naphthoate octaprenyltransferase [Spirochaetota bacterium]